MGTFIADPHSAMLEMGLLLPNCLSFPYIQETMSLVAVL